VLADPAKVAQRLRAWPGVSISAFHVEFADDLPRETAETQLKAISRLARVMAAPVLSVVAAKADSDFEKEVIRLTAFSKICAVDGVTCAVETRVGTLTETPEATLELCKRVPALGVVLDPSHYMVGPGAGRCYDDLFPYVKHVRLRDTGKDAEHFQVRIGQGQIEYGRIITQLARYRYNRLLSVAMHDDPQPAYPLQPEVRKLKYLLESLI
jgi:sugar phosphate isomerase/epimerase